MANRKFIKLNQFPSSIQSPNDYNTHLFNNIFLQFNDEWLFFIPNLFHSLISAISSFFHSILSCLYAIPNFFHSLLSSLSNFLHSLFMIIPNLFHSLHYMITNLFHSLLSKLSVFPDLFHSLLSKLSVIPDLFHSLMFATTNLFHSLVYKLSVIPNLFHSLVSEATNIFHSLISETTNLYHSLGLVTTNFFHSLLAKFDEACPPETRAHILKVATPFVIAGFGVALLCLVCYFYWPAIASCMTRLPTAVKKLVSGFFSLLKGICSCCTRNSSKMMKAPGTGGKIMIPRPTFESNPASYFSNLRASNKLPLLG